MEPILKIGTVLPCGTVTAITKYGVAVGEQVLSFKQVEEMLNDDGKQVEG